MKDSGFFNIAWAAIGWLVAAAIAILAWRPSQSSRSSCGSGAAAYTEAAQMMLHGREDIHDADGLEHRMQSFHRPLSAPKMRRKRCNPT
jgi:hypothetical protein